MTLDKQFWDGTRWDGHAAFQTINHIHICAYQPADGHDVCDILAVECQDGRWYLEDSWGGDAKGAAAVWNPFDPSDTEPRFFETREAAVRHAVAVVAEISGIAESVLLSGYAG